MDYSGEILNSAFYTHHGNGKIWLGVVIVPFGSLAEEFDEADWVEWLRAELARCEVAKVPKVFDDAFNGKE